MPSENKITGMLKRVTEYDRLGSHIEMFGSSLVCAEGCQGVLCYSEDMVKISLGSRSLQIVGCDLRITGMFGSTVRIEGQIRCVEFI